MGATLEWLILCAGVTGVLIVGISVVAGTSFAPVAALVAGGVALGLVAQQLVARRS